MTILQTLFRGLAAVLFRAALLGLAAMLVVAPAQSASGVRSSSSAISRLSIPGVRRATPSGVKVATGYLVRRGR